MYVEEICVWRERAGVPPRARARIFFIGDARGRIAGWTLHESVRVSNLQNQIPALNTVAPHI